MTLDNTPERANPLSGEKKARYLDKEAHIDRSDNG